MASKTVFFVCDFHSSLDDESLYVTIEALNFELAPGPDSQVPVGDYELPIGQAEVVQEGTDATQLH